MGKSSICCLQFIRLPNFCLLQRTFMEESLTETDLVKLSNTPTRHGQKKEAYSTLNSILFFVKLSTNLLQPKEKGTQRHTEVEQTSLGLESVACVHRTRFIFCFIPPQVLFQNHIIILVGRDLGSLCGSNCSRLGENWTRLCPDIAWKLHEQTSCKLLWWLFQCVTTLTES